MKAVHKYHADPRGVYMPPGAEVVHAEFQHTLMTVWAIVDPVAQCTELRRFQIFGTGANLPDGAKHVTTWLEEGGQFVWHLIEVPA